MNKLARALSRSAAAVAGVVVASGLVLVQAPAAQADTAPADPTNQSTPPTVSSDPLPTVQINGIVWAQVVVGNTVYVGGAFSQARPAGAAPGTNETPRANLLAYNINTGELINSWVANTNGEVNTLTASPDGSRIYAGGVFTSVTSVNSQGNNVTLTRRRIVALNPANVAPSQANGNVVGTFAPNPDARVQAIAATNSTVYFGGGFGVVSNNTRTKLAAVQASNGALLNWAPTASDNVHAMILSPDESQVLVGGEFQQLNGSSNPGYGLGSLDPVTGQLLPWAANQYVRNANNGNATGAINSLSRDGASVYATGYTFGRAGGSLEGVAKMSWNGGALEWVNDCHGDTYGSYPMGDAVYAVSHEHYCGNLPGGSFHQTEPWKYYRATAFSHATTGTLRTEYNGYTNWAGTPAPSQLHWYPELDAGDVSGQTQAAWAITGNSDYVVAGGEFPRVERVAQEGLVRFARRAIAPNDQGPEVRGTNTNPNVRAVGDGQMLVCWRGNWDRDNAELTYEVIKGTDVNNPLDTRTVASTEWNMPDQCYLDTNGTATSEYRIFTIDPLGNEERSAAVSAGVNGSGAADNYAKAVVADGPQHYWRFSEPSGTTVADYTGWENATTSAGVTRGVPGVIPGDPAATFDGTTAQTMANSTPRPGDFWYTVEAWFNTTTTRGGKILGYGSAQTGNSSSSRSDRNLYMDGSGRINFGSRMGSNRVLTSQSGLNNGQWHHAVGVQDPNGMSLYIDGVRVGTRVDNRAGAPYDGYWRVGGDTLSNWPNRPSGGDYFPGSIDEVAVYARALTPQQVRSHFLASGATVTTPTDDYGQAVYNDQPDFFWRLAETGGTTAADSSNNNNTGTYVNSPTQGGASAVGLAGDSSVTFDGTNDIVPQSVGGTSPDVYSAETWFKTSTTTGGRLIGFGNSQTGSSTTADRQVFMTNGGKLRFATLYAGTQHFLESPASYNNNAWHHLVAAQGPTGMRLYVDSVLVASNTQGATSPYTGFWRLGGDNLTGWAERPSTDFFNGQLDEAAVYKRVLAPNEVEDHFLEAGGTVPNTPPTVSFTTDATGLSVDFDSTASDTDGTIASYAWSFGDGGTSTQQDPTHVFPDTGNYTVQLTVTDNQGGSTTASQVVSVTNQPPTADWSSTSNGLTLNATATASDSDGTVAGYSWNWGDGTANGSGASASHTYGAAGNYTVTLTVTDNHGAQTTVPKQVTVSTAPQVLATDAFGRTASGGWGTATTGGPWTISGTASRWSVAGGRGVYTAPSAGTGHFAYLNNVSAANVEGVVDVTQDKAITGSGTLFAAAARRNGDTRYQFVTRINGNGSMQAYITKVVANVETVLTTKVTVPGGNYALGDVLRMRFGVSGSSPASLQLKVWKVGTTEPTGWTVTTADTTAGLGGTGAVGLYSYLFGTATNAPVAMQFDNLNVTGPGGGPPANQPPTADWSSTSNGLTLNATATASDSDGTVAGYSWNWGDGTANGSGASASHTYGAAGNYTVTLTVTDDDGAQTAVPKQVSVSAAGQPLAVDAFGRTASGGWGTATTGGPWTISGTASRWSVAGGRGVYTAPSAGTGHFAYLNNVSAANVEGVVDVTQDKAITGSGTLFAAAARRNGDTRYQFVTRINGNGSMQAYITKVVANVETVLTTKVTVPGGNYALGDVLRMRFGVSGSSPASLQLKVWKVGTTEPTGWTVTTADTTAGLGGTGAVGLYSYLFGTATNAPVAMQFDNLQVS